MAVVGSRAAKQVLSLTIISVLSLGIINGCAYGKTVKLKFAGRTPKSSSAWEYIEGAMKQFEKEHPGIKIEYIAEAGHDEYLEKLLTMAAAGAFPDVIHLYQPWVFSLAERNLTEPYPANITNRLRDRFYPITLQSLTTKGRLYALPTENQVMGLIYNKKLLREAGVGSPPNTWDELEALAMKFAKQEPGKPKRFGLSNELSSWATPAILRAMLVAFGGKFMDKTELAFNGSVGIKVVTMLRKWHLETKMASIDTSLIGQDKAAFSIGYPWHIYHLEPKLGNKLQDLLGVAEMPAGPGGRAAYHYSWGYSISKSSKAKKEAMSFVEFMETKEGKDGLTYVGGVMSTIGSLPSIKSDEGKARFATLSQWFGGYAKNLKWAVPTDGLAQQEKIDAILAEELNPVITTAKSTPAVALDNAKRRIDAVLKKRR